MKNQNNETQWKQKNGKASFREKEYKQLTS